MSTLSKGGQPIYAFYLIDARLRLPRPASASHRQQAPPEPQQRLLQRPILHLRDGRLQRLLLRRRERPLLGWGQRGGRWWQRSLHELEAADGAEAEVGVDALDDLRGG